MSEVWKDVDEYEGLYQVSNYGRVKSLKYGKERILKTVENNGYQHVLLFKNGKGKWFYVHRMVAQAFIPNPDNLTEINHISEIKNDNRVVNLEWCNRVYNLTYGSRIKQISKKVQQYSLDGELIKKWPSAYEVKRQLGYSQSHINECCLGKRKTANGYIWRYAD